MKLIIGLGNPDTRYRKNRHNVGFMFVDWLLKKYQISNIKYQNDPTSPRLRGTGTLTFKSDKYSESEICKIEIDGKELILAKPQTFMNKSGIAATRLVTRFTLHVSRDCFVVHDDLDIGFGQFKIQKGKGPQLHNGIESIEKSLRTKDFWRVRIGVDNRDPANRMPGEAYVLQDFSQSERTAIEKLFPKIYRDLLEYL